MIVAIAAAAVLAPTMAGCTANDSAALEDDAGGGLPGPDASIEFASDGTLTLAPGEKATITVVTAPAERYEISFLLVGDTLDASLSESTVVANDQGEASVDLRAPNSATSFAVRAKIKDGNTADLPVAVSDQGFGALDITPVYNGDRDIADWSAFVVSGKSCEALGTTFPDDPPGALVAGAEQGDPLVVDVARETFDVPPALGEPRGEHLRLGLALGVPEVRRHETAGVGIEEAGVGREHEVGYTLGLVDGVDGRAGVDQRPVQRVPLAERSVDVDRDLLVHPRIDLIEHAEVLWWAQEVVPAPVECCHAVSGPAARRRAGGRRHRCR